MSDPLVHLNDDRDPYVPAVVPPDAARDARVAARRAADARRAGVALERFIADLYYDIDQYWEDQLSGRIEREVANALSRLQHKRHYARPTDPGPDQIICESRSPLGTIRCGLAEGHAGDHRSADGFSGWPE